MTLNAGARRIRVQIEQRALLVQRQQRVGHWLQQFLRQIGQYLKKPTFLPISHIIDQNPSELGQQPAEIAEALVLTCQCVRVSSMSQPAAAVTSGLSAAVFPVTS